MLEKDIEKYLTSEVKRLGGIAYKFVSPGNDGVPDRMVLLPGGRITFIELKTETGRPTKIQERQIERMRALGQDVRIVYGMEQVKEFLREARDAVYTAQVSAVQH